MRLVSIFLVHKAELQNQYEYTEIPRLTSDPANEFFG